MIQFWHGSKVKSESDELPGQGQAQPVPYTMHDYQGRGKPSPYPIRCTTTRAGASPARTLYDARLPGQGQAQPVPYTNQASAPYKVRAGLAPALVATAFPCKNTNLSEQGEKP